MHLTVDQLDTLARLLLASHRIEDAAYVVGAAVSLRERLRKLETIAQADLGATLAGELHRETVRTAWHRGRALTVDQITPDFLVQSLETSPAWQSPGMDPSFHAGHGA